MDIEEKRVAFDIINLKELGFSYSEPPFNLIIEYKNDLEKFLNKIQVGLNVAYRWDIAKNYFAVSLDFYYRYYDEAKSIELLLLKYSNITEFIVTDFQDIFKDMGNGEFEINEQWETTFVNIAISSGRGMLAARTAGTFMGAGPFVFPITDPSDHILTKKRKLKKNES